MSRLDDYKAHVARANARTTVSRAIDAIAECEGLKGLITILNSVCLDIELNHEEELNESDSDLMWSISDMTSATQQWLDKQEEN